MSDPHVGPYCLRVQRCSWCFGLLAAGAILLGADVGSNDFRVSDMGADDQDRGFDATVPAIAHNSTDDEYLVVWIGADDSGALVYNEFEVFGQLLDGAGNEIGGDIRISDLGPDGDASFSAAGPDVAYNSATNEYLVVWVGEDDIPPLVVNEREVFGQRLDAAGGEVGPNDFRISEVGPNGSVFESATSPTVSYNSAADEYLVVWSGDLIPGLSRDLEVYGQRLEGTGNQVGPNDFRISDMGPDEQPGDFEAFAPDVAYNGSTNEYLVVWFGDDDSGALVTGELEVFGQRLDSPGNEIGVNDFRISDMGSVDGDPNFDATSPSVAYGSNANEFLVVWSADDDEGLLVDNEREIFGQRLDSGGTEVGPNDFRISDMGSSDGETQWTALGPDVSHNPDGDEYLVAWWGDDDAGLLVVSENEIFGQQLDGAGDEIGENDFRISDAGPDGDPDFSATSPRGVYSSGSNEFLVVWQANEIAPSGLPVPNGPLEIYGQRLAAGFLNVLPSLAPLSFGILAGMLVGAGERVLRRRLRRRS